MMYDRLPEERDLPEADEMLRRILDDEPTRRRRPLVPVAAAVVLVALGAGGALALQHFAGGDALLAPATQATTSSSIASRPSVSTTAPSVSTTAPSVSTPSRSAGPSTSTPANSASSGPSRDAAGVQHFSGPGTARFAHFTVTVGEAPEKTADGRWARRATVCVVELGPEPIDGRTTISWAPWSISQAGSAVTRVTSQRAHVPTYPEHGLYAPGECATGFLTFAGDPAAPTTVTYSNHDYGETAVWHLGPGA